MRISAFTQIIVTVAVTAWVFILPVKAVATILVFELALLLSIKRDRMTMAAIGGLAVARICSSFFPLSSCMERMRCSMLCRICSSCCSVRRWR